MDQLLQVIAQPARAERRVRKTVCDSRSVRATSTQDTEVQCRTALLASARAP